MGDLVNLKRFKKRGERDDAAKQADANRARFGRTKSERALDQLHTKRADTVLDQHRLNQQGLDGQGLHSQGLDDGEDAS